MRYTQYNKELERYVVPCLFKPDGSEISFSIITGETYTAENGAGMRYPIGKDPDLVYGEVIDRLAVLENNSEKLAEVLLEREDTMQLLAKENQEYYDIINRQKAEIERLREIISVTDETLKKCATIAKAEAVKDTLKRLREISTPYGYGGARLVTEFQIDSLLQDMTEETP